MSIPPLMLTQEQAARLLAYLQTYRRYALTQLAPSTERNATQRLLQTVQGRLIQERERPGMVSALWLVSEELTALRTMATDLLMVTRQEAGSERRNATLDDLVALKLTLERLALSSPRRQGTNALW